LFTASLIFRDIASGFFSIVFILCCTSRLSCEFLIWIDGFSVPKKGDNLSQRLVTPRLV
jgi:hypothetical protein